METNQLDGGSEVAEPTQIVHRRQSLGEEDFHLRNYDHEWAYDLDVEFVDESGDVVYQDRFYLQPGHTRSSTDAVPAGTYDVIVVLDNTVRRSLRCRIDERTEHTAVSKSATVR